MVHYITGQQTPGIQSHPTMDVAPVISQTKEYIRAQNVWHWLKWSKDIRLALSPHGNKYEFRKSVFRTWNKE